MSPVYEDGLHLATESGLRHGQYSTLPQVYEPSEKSTQPQPQAYVAEKSPEAAPVPVSTEDPKPPRYDGLRYQHADADKPIPSPTPQPQSRQILGMKRRTAILVGIAALIAIIALVVGLGVGLSARSSNDDTIKSSVSSGGASTTNISSTFSLLSSTAITISMSNPSTTASQLSSNTVSTASAVATSGFTGVSEVRCPGINNTVTTSGSAQFQVLCAVHWITGQPAANNNGSVQAVGSNKLVAYTLEECLDHCVEYNSQLNNTVNPHENGSGCLAVTYNANLTSAFAKFEQNCFLKDRQGVYDSAAGTTESAILISL